MIYAAIFILTVVGDQLSKSYISRNYEVGQSMPLIEGVFHLTYVQNRGAAFGILQNARWFFIAATIFVLGAALYYMIKERPKSALLRTAVSLVCAGAAGNLIDRILMGYVVDFFDFTLINFAVFNIADSAVVIGAGLLIIYYLFIQKPKADESHA